jgi:hypothetical protein
MTKEIIPIFPLWTFYLYVGTFQQHLHMEYLSPSLSDIPEHDILDGGFLLTRKLLSSEFLVVKLKSSFRKFYHHNHDLVNCYGISVSQMAMDISCFRNHYPFLSLFMTYHRYCNKSNTTGLHVEKELLTLPGDLSSHSVFNGVCGARSLVLRVVICVICPSIYGFWLPLWYSQTIFLLDDICTFKNSWSYFKLRWCHVIQDNA